MEVSMSRTRSRFVFHSCACLIALLAIGALASCGGSDSDDAQKLSFTAESKGKSVTFTVPESAEAGLAEITVTNDSDAEADLQLIRVEGDRTPEEVVQGLGKAIQGQSFPEWFFAAGGVGTLEAGESATVTQVLQPGDYYAFNTESNGPPDPKTVAVTKVSGEESDDELAEGDATVEGGEYVFNAETLPSGSTEILFDNIGAQPHHLIASKFISEDATAEDVEKFFKTEKGKPPISEKGTQSTAVLEGGEGQLVTMDLEPGRYALYCFITDREGGPPHAFKGMIDEVEVE
jgi:hypothetical protein